MPVRCPCGGNLYRVLTDGEETDARRRADLGPPRGPGDVTSERVALERRLLSRLSREATIERENRYAGLGTTSHVELMKESRRSTR